MEVKVSGMSKNRYKALALKIGSVFFAAYTLLPGCAYSGSGDAKPNPDDYYRKKINELQFRDPAEELRKKQEEKSSAGADGNDNTDLTSGFTLEVSLDGKMEIKKKSDKDEENEHVTRP